MSSQATCVHWTTHNSLFSNYQTIKGLLFLSVSVWVNGEGFVDQTHLSFHSKRTAHRTRSTLWRTLEMACTWTCTGKENTQWVSHTLRPGEIRHCDNTTLTHTLPHAFPLSFWGAGTRSSTEQQSREQEWYPPQWTDSLSGLLLLLVGYLYGGGGEPSSSVSAQEC